MTARKYARSLLEAGEEARRQASLLLLDCGLMNSLTDGAKETYQPLAPDTALKTLLLTLTCVKV